MFVFELHVGHNEDEYISRSNQSKTVKDEKHACCNGFRVTHFLNRPVMQDSRDFTTDVDTIMEPLNLLHFDSCLVMNCGLTAEFFYKLRVNPKSDFSQSDFGLGKLGQTFLFTV